MPDLLLALEGAGDGSDIRFCFVLGSGASITSGVPTGATLVDDWLKSLFSSDCPDEPLDRMQAWAEKRFEFAWADRAESYGRVYKQRFPENAVGQAELRRLMKEKAPSFGYHALAQIISRTRNNVVITTNFDNLVEDALIAHGARSFTARSAADAAFLDQNDDKPRILKLHGDIDRETYNADVLIKRLDKRWESPLSMLLGRYTPLFLGYGGCDPGFMGFLNERYVGGFRHKPVWTYRVNSAALTSGSTSEPPGGPTTPLARQFFAKHDAWRTPIPGFDELMLLLAPRLRLEHSGRAITAVAERAREVYEKSLAEASRAARRSVAEGSKSWCPQLENFVRHSERHLLGDAAARSWREWREYINAAVSHGEAIDRAREAVTALPEDPRISATLALLLQSQNPLDAEAERVMNEARLAATRFADDSGEALWLDMAWGLWLMRSGQWEAATRQFAGSLERHNQVLGNEHPDTLAVRHYWAEALLFQGQAADAEAVMREILDARERVLGVDHPDTLSVLHTVAMALYMQGKAAQAEALQRRVLDARERLLGVAHHDTLASSNNLALALCAQGKAAEAEALILGVLDVREKVLGAEHPVTLSSRDNLALTLYVRGRHLDAESMLRDVLEARQRVQGAEHPATLSTQHALAAALHQRGNNDEAEVLFRSVREARERVLGPRHRDTLSCGNNLAMVLSAQGRDDDAEAMLRQVLDDQERLLGIEHPETLASRNNVAMTLFARGEDAAAEAMYRQVLEAHERVLGSDHPSTLTSASNLAGVLFEQGKVAEAESLYRQVLETRELVLGPDHPDTLTSRRLLTEKVGPTPHPPETKPPRGIRGRRKKHHERGEPA